MYSAGRQWNVTSIGFSHSEIPGSTPVYDSSGLIAVCHVLHRLLTPRHSPCALSSLATNLRTHRPGKPEREPQELASTTLVRFAIYNFETKVPPTMLVRAWYPFLATLDCFGLSLHQDTLSRRRLLFSCQGASRLIASR